MALLKSVAALAAVVLVAGCSAAAPTPIATPAGPPIGAVGQPLAIDGAAIQANVTVVKAQHSGQLGTLMSYEFLILYQSTGATAVNELNWQAFDHGVLMQPAIPSNSPPLPLTSLPGGKSTDGWVAFGGKAFMQSLELDLVGLDGAVIATWPVTQITDFRP